MSKGKELSGLITGLAAILAVACFMVLGFTTRAWHPTWIVFFAIPITAVICDIVLVKKDIQGAITGAAALIAAAVFLLLGFFLGIWAIAWIVFLIIPIIAIIMNIINTVKKDKQD